MERSNCKLLVGLMMGIATGIAAYRLAQTSKARELRKQMCHCMHDLGNKAGEVLNELKEKAMTNGSQIAEQVSEKAEEIKNKVHGFADSNRK